MIILLRESRGLVFVFQEQYEGDGEDLWLIGCVWRVGLISDGTCVRDYLHVMDLAKGHVLSLDAIQKNQIFDRCESEGEGQYRAFNLGKGKGQSVLNMIEAMKKASGFEYKYEIIGKR